MDTFQSLFDQWRSLGAVLTVAVVLPVLIAACSDDPVLGPSDGESDGGGSYSVIEGLAQPGTATSDSTEASSSDNPERF